MSFDRFHGFTFSKMNVYLFIRSFSIMLQYNPLLTYQNVIEQLKRYKTKTRDIFSLLKRLSRVECKTLYSSVVVSLSDDITDKFVRSKSRN